MKYLFIFIVFLTGCTLPPSESQSVQSSSSKNSSDIGSLKVIIKPINSEDKKYKPAYIMKMNIINNYSTEISYPLTSLLLTELSRQYKLIAIEKNLENINSNLSSISTDLKKQPLDNTGSDYGFFPKLILSSMPFFIFLWGLILMQKTEAKAKLGMISPLLEQSSLAITKAKERFSAGHDLNLIDLEEITLPLIQAERSLKNSGLADFILEPNDELFKYIKMTMPANITIELNTRSLLSIATICEIAKPNSRSTNIINRRNKILSYYDEIKSKLLGCRRSYHKKRKYYSYLISSVIVIGLFTFYLITTITTTK